MGRAHIQPIDNFLLQCKLLGMHTPKTSFDPRRLAYPFSPTSYWGKRMMSMRIAKNDPGPVLY